MRDQYGVLFVLVNLAAFYGYLFWNSHSLSAGGFTGDASDMLFLKSDRFMDWVNTLRSAALPGPYSATGQVAMPVYGPTTYALLRPIVWLQGVLPSYFQAATFAWLLISVISVIVFAFSLQSIRSEVCTASPRFPVSQLLLCALASFPLLFAFDRGNIELPLLALVSWYISRVLASRAALPATGSRPFLLTQMILAVAVSIKPYLILFALVVIVDSRILFSQRLVRLLISVIQVSAAALVLTIGSMFFLYGGHLSLGFAEFANWQSQFKLAYVVGSSGDLFFVSPYVAIKSTLLMRAAPAWLVLLLYRAYPLLALIICVDLLMRVCRYCRSRPDSVVLFVTLAFVLLVFPFNSNEYKAVYLLLPFLIAPCGSCEGSVGLPVRLAGLRFHDVVTPRSVSIGLSFVILSNRYGLLGDRWIASMVASVALLLYPLLLLPALRRAEGLQSLESPCALT